MLVIQGEERKVRRSPLWVTDEVRLRVRKAGIDTTE